MFTGSMMKLKSILYGTLPFYYTKVFEPSSPKLAYYDYFRKRGYTRYPYDFAAEYLEMSIAVLWDKEKELPYVMHRGSKRLYFPREYSTSKIEKCYRALLIEQDVRHPHHYADSVEEFRGKTLLVIGSAEGLPLWIPSRLLVLFIFLNMRINGSRRFRLLLSRGKRKR